MNSAKSTFLWTGLTLPLLLFTMLAAYAQETLVIGPVAPVEITSSLYDLSLQQLGQPAGDVAEPIPPRQITNPDALLRPRPLTPPKIDPLLELQLDSRQAERVFTTPDVNVPGHFNTCCPPDTVGEVGPDHFVQMTNGTASALGTAVSIYDKTGAQVVAPFSLRDHAPAGSGCELSDGDPIPLYDQFANRWILTNFETSGGAGVHGFCMFVSSDHDLVNSTWTVYKFPTPGAIFPDYPKFAVWPDAYYIGTNEAAHPVYAVDRLKMLAGQPATMLVQNIPTTLAGFGFQITSPVDVAGPVRPPQGAPGIFIRHRDDEAHDGAATVGDTLELFEFHADFATPGNSTLTGPTSIAVADFDSDLCGLVSFLCFPQPLTTQLLDPLREPIMQRPVYRNFGTHQSLVGNLTVDVDGNDRGGIRWFELRRASEVATGGWSTFQEGTFSPDAVNRWMGSLAIDKQGNMAIGYSVGDGTAIYPGIRYTGRTVAATLGTMDQGETSIVDGGVAQVGSERWGDYSGMTVDPVDDCTFWYTTEYMPAGAGSFDPRTRIASFNFDACENSCTDPDSENLALSAENVVVTENYEVCNTITSGPSYTIAATGDVTMQAGRSVVLLNGFSVSTGGKLQVIIQ